MTQVDAETRDQLVTVIETTNAIEELATAVLQGSCLPPFSRETAQGHILFSYLVHNTIVSLGAKFTFIGILIDHYKWKDLQRDARCLHEVLRYRNAFAHTPIARKIMVYGPIEFPGRSGKVAAPLLEERLMVETKSQGKPKWVSRKEALEQFTKHAQRASELLSAVMERLNALKETSANNPLDIAAGRGESST